MDTLYKCIIKNNLFEQILTNLFDKKKILIIKDDDNISEDLSEILNSFNEDLFVNSAIKDIKSSNSLNFDRNIEKLKVLKRKIESTSNKILNIFNIFSDNNSFSYSLNDLYSKTISNITFKDDEFKFYNILKEADFLECENSSSITDAAINILKSNLVFTFIKYKKYMNYHKFEVLNKEVNEKNISSLINKLSSLLNNPYTFIPPIFFNKYTSDFINECIYYQLPNDDSLKDKVKKINEKHNAQLLNQINELSKFNFYNLFNKKKINKQKLKLLNQYNEEEYSIYKQYSENIDNLNLYVNSFSFIREVFNDNVFDNIKKYLLQDDELQSYIENLKNLLVSYKDYLNIKKIIDTTDQLELTILEYCYNHYQTNDSLKNLISFIPKFYLYKSIYEIESKNSTFINSYNNISKYIDSLYYALSKFKSLLIDTFHPIYILSKKDTTAHYYDYNECFDIVIKDSKQKNINVGALTNKSNIINSKIIKDIIKLLSPFDCFISVDENIVKVKRSSTDSSNTIIYLNPPNIFTENDLIDILNYKNSFSNTIFIWSRDWWINKNDELIKLQNSISKFLLK